SRLPAAGPSVRFVNVQSQSQSSLSSPILPPNLQKLLNALSVLSGTPNDVHMHEATLPAPPPPIAHLTHNAEYICSRHRMGR
ncbi:unnamed protein product, partial [Rotaria magnacalcarata]